MDFLLKKRTIKIKMEIIRTYSELLKLPSFEERFTYLMETSSIGEIKFGHDRYLNQAFYNSGEWKSVRNFVIIRDNGCDLGMPDYPIIGMVIVHHMNRITEEDILKRSRYILDPEYLICVSRKTHHAITYGDPSSLPKKQIERFRNDTCPWKKD